MPTKLSSQSLSGAFNYVNNYVQALFSPGKITAQLSRKKEKCRKKISETPIFLRFTLFTYLSTRLLLRFKSYRNMLHLSYISFYNITYHSILCKSTKPLKTLTISLILPIASVFNSCAEVTG